MKRGGAMGFAASNKEKAMERIDYREADFWHKDLRNWNFDRVDLRDAELVNADMRGVDLRNAWIDHANLIEADMRGVILPDGVPIIPDIHKRVYEAASQDGALNMSNWHDCETTHCRAGWVVSLAGAAGSALESRYGTGVAAALIYMASDPTLESIPDWTASEKEALADMKRLADAKSSH